MKWNLELSFSSPVITWVLGGLSINTNWSYFWLPISTCRGNLKTHDKVDNDNFIKFITYTNKSDIVLKVGQDSCSRLSSHVQKAKKLSFHPCKKKQKNWMKWKINSFSWAHQRNEVKGHMSIWEFEEKSEPRVTERSFLRAETTRAVKW